MQDLIESYVLGEMTPEQAQAEIMAKFTDPKAAKKAIVADAKKAWIIDFIKHRSIDHARAVKGSTAAGAFPHKPNPKIIKMHLGLWKLFAGVRDALQKQGYASDEREDRMGLMLDRVKKGDLMDRESVQSLLKQIKKEWG